MGGVPVECSSNGSGISVETGKLNTITKSFAPWAMYRCHYKNVNCFDETDSMRVYFSMSGGPEITPVFSRVLYGCVDSISPSDLSYYPFIPTQNTHMELEKRVYRNGWDTIIYQSVDLNMDGVIQEIEITY